MEKNKQIEFYNNYWKDLSKFGSYKLKRISKIITLLNIAKKTKKKPKILDLGCGDGRCCAIWNEIGNTTGLDLSETAMQVASKRYPFISFQSGDGTNTSFKNNSFDIIISQEVIEHIEIQSEYLNECYRLLSSDGLLILTTPNKLLRPKKWG
jgi:2-polyprenyl-3-methyl-5-hydroxy-6-metoxy-1,4-benzoquinol methylase